MNAHAIDAPGMRIVEIDWERIKPFSGQPRRALPGSENDIPELVQSIKECGQIYPVIVRKLIDGDPYDYELVDGERRYHAIREAGIRHIRAIVTNVDNEEQYILASAANLGRKDFELVEKVWLVQKLIAYGKTLKQIAAFAAMGERTARKYCAVANLPPDIIALMKPEHGDSRLTLEAAYQLTGRPKSKQREEALYAVSLGSNAAQHVKWAARRDPSPAGNGRPRRGRKPDSLDTALEKFLTRTIGQGSLWKRMPAEEFARLFSGRRPRDIVELTKSINECLFIFRTLYQRVQIIEGA